ncbi:MAG: TonB-dependent receptor [Saprospiraceae bacterium]|nr:TonB-dependent receptor [Saprospiraceae bacterium]
MIIRIRSTIFLFLSLFFISETFSQKNITISGYVADKEEGEHLIGANVTDLADQKYAVFTNNYGFYSLNLPKGYHKLKYSYLGYQPEEIVIDLAKDTVINIELISGILLQNVVIDAKKQESRNNITGSQVGTVKLDVGKIKSLPALMGEVDVLKSIQLLPGVKSSGDGNSGFYVRGGGSDQNLVLLDEAVVYNTGHMLGFFSVFNADAIKGTTLIKGGMPANYGQRLSSVVDIKMKEGSDKHFGVDGGIGLISSRLTVEGPIIKNKSSFIFSGRRTYVLDLAQPFLKGNKFEGTNYYFYDLNVKFNYKFSDKDRVFFSGYYGRDIFTLNFATRDFKVELPYGNSIAALRWNHVFNNRIFMNSSVIYNDYKYELGAGQEKFSFSNFSGVHDWNIKTDFEYYLNFSHKIKFGHNYTYHKLNPNILNINAEGYSLQNGGEPVFSHENSLYLMDDWNLNKSILLSVGLRGTLYSQMGNYTSKIDNKKYKPDELVKNYLTLDPRFNFRWTLDKNTSLKGSLTYTSQFLHQVSNSSGSFPSDIWVSSSEYVKPASGIQYSLGLFRNLFSDNYETSFELYYKDLKNQIEFREDYTGGIESDLENKFVFGIGRAYGLELFVKKNSGKLTGWIGYTFSKTERKFELINNNLWFKTTYDKPHDISVVLNYSITEKWSFNSVFVYGSGRRYTPVTDLYVLDGKVNLEYGTRNSATYSPYHRLDISVSYEPKTIRKWKSSWSFGVYNVYNRKNPTFISYDTDIGTESGKNSITASKITIFPIIPSITYNFKWHGK